MLDDFCNVSISNFSGLRLFPYSFCGEAELSSKAQLCVKWIIEDFWSMGKMQRKFKSPQYSIPIDLEGKQQFFKFSLQMDVVYVSEEEEEDEYCYGCRKFFAVKVTPLDKKSHSEWKFHFHCLTQDFKGKEIHGYGSCESEFEGLFPFKEFPKSSAVMRAKSQDLHLIFYFTILTDHEESKSCSLEWEKEEGFDFLKKFQEMPDEEKITHLKIVCHGEVFNCHKSILACRSEYFKAMFHFKDTNGEKIEQYISTIHITTYYISEMKFLLLQSMTKHIVFL